MVNILGLKSHMVFVALKKKRFKKEKLCLAPEPSGFGP